ncbi:MAG TPA: hypothetical protein DCQ98_21110 [Planctomycetaceae bacterium]|nr:hypothetical protein [Planctomycetaceae bacterium]
MRRYGRSESTERRNVDRTHARTLERAEGRCRCGDRRSRTDDSTEPIAKRRPDAATGSEQGREPTERRRHEVSIAIEFQDIARRGRMRSAGRSPGS